MATQMKNTDNKVSKDAKETIRMATQMETTDNMVGKDAKETIQRHPPEVAETIPTSSGSLIPIIILISFAAFGSYILGYLKWSILWTSVFLFTSYNFMFRRLNRLRQYHLNALQREAARQRLERHAESAEWLNFIIERLWNVLEPIISIKATEKINAVLLDSCPTFLDSLMLTEFTLGSSSPNIVTARVHPQTQPDIIHLDAELRFIPNEADSVQTSQNSAAPQWNSKIVLAARVGKGILGVDVPVMIKEISIFGKLRVQLELSPTTPFLSKIEFAFLEVPQIDFILKPLKSFDLMDLPGLSNWLSSTINEVLAAKVVDPNLISIPLKKRYSDVRSMGVLKVSLYEVRGMRLGGVINHPFVRLQIGGKYRAVSTELDEKTMAWNQVFYVLVHSLKNPISFIVVGSSSNVIGSVTFPIADIITNSGAYLNVWRTIVGHESSKIKGELKFGVEYSPAADQPDPEADLDFESGIVQISLHQIKELLETDSKPNCCYEVYVHPSSLKIDAKDPPQVPEGMYYRSKTKKKTVTPQWDEVFEVFLEHKDRASITFLLRHGTKDDVIYGQWTGSFKNLLNRTDWFVFDGHEKAQLYASFLFRPVRIDVSSGADIAFTPCLGVVRVHVISGAGFKTGKGQYQVALDVSEREVGKTKASLVEGTPVWNKRFVAITKDSRDIITLDVRNVEKGTSFGRVTCTVNELLSHTGFDIEKNENLSDGDGRALNAKLRFTVGLFPAEEGSIISEGEPYDLIPESAKKINSNCGILEVQSIQIEGVLPTTIHSMHFLKAAFENCDPFLKTSPAHITSEGRHAWKKKTEHLIHDSLRQELFFTIYEIHGARDEYVDGTHVQLASLKCNEWVKLDGITQGRLQLTALYRPIPLQLEPDPVDSGMLQIQILEAHDLIAVDSGGTSDPFCVLRLNGTKFFKSKVIKKCLDPIFEETTELEIKQRDVSVLQVELRDWNKVAASRTLGLVNIELQNLPPNQWQDVELELENVSSGKLHLRLQFIPDQDGLGGKKGTAAPLSNNMNVIAVPSLRQDRDSQLPPLPEGEESRPPSPKQPQSSEPSLGTKGRESAISALSLASAAGIRVTIVSLNTENTFEPFDCKVKIRNNDRTIFKTRNIHGTEHHWNESFIIDPETRSDLHITLSWEKHTANLPLDLSKVEGGGGDVNVEIPLVGIEGGLVIKYSLTMDTHNLLDTEKHRRRFSLLGR